MFYDSSAIRWIPLKMPSSSNYSVSPLYLHADKLQTQDICIKCYAEYSTVKVERLVLVCLIIIEFFTER